MTLQSVTLVGKLNDPLFQKAKKSAEVRGHNPNPPRWPYMYIFPKRAGGPDAAREGSVERFPLLSNAPFDAACWPTQARLPAGLCISRRRKRQPSAAPWKGSSGARYSAVATHGDWVHAVLGDARGKSGTEGPRAFVNSGRAGRRD